MEDKKSTLDVFFILRGNLVTWMSQNQGIVALCSNEAKYMSFMPTALQCIWLADLVNELNFENLKPFKTFVDNKSAIDLAMNLTFHNWSKHFHSCMF